MSRHPQCLSEALTSAIKSCDYVRVRDILDGVEHLPFACSMIDGSPLHTICNLGKHQQSELEWECSFVPEREKLIIYMLVDAGFDTEQVDKNGNTCLFYAVKNESVYICDILLQCGADMWAQTEKNKAV